MKRLAAVLVTLLLSTACASGKSGTPTAQPTLQSQPTPTVSPCAPASGKGFSWPSPVPGDLPQPPHAQFSAVSTTANGLTIVRFRTFASLQDAVLFVVHEVQKAGYTLGRGDAEPAEADAPFGKGDLRGVYKMLSTAPCVTDWLVATTRTTPTGTSPLLPTPSHGPSSQPLPFG